MSNGDGIRRSRVIIGEAVYTMATYQIPTNSLDVDKPLVCPFCQRQLRVLSELVQFGEFEDKNTLRLACVPCEAVFMYNHIFSRIEVKNDAAN